MKRDLDLMDNILDGIENTDSKNEMMMNDPAVRAADNVLMNALEKIRGTVPDNVIGEIEDAAAGYASAVGTFNLLSGMHVMNIVAECSRNPSEFSQYILDRVNRRRAS